jgi:hypothetical protein
MTRDEAAEKLAINRTHLDILCRGDSRPGLALAVAIEKLTDGAIAVADWIETPVQKD